MLTRSSSPIAFDRSTVSKTRPLRVADQGQGRFDIGSALRETEIAAESDWRRTALLAGRVRTPPAGVAAAKSAAAPVETASVETAPAPVETASVEAAPVVVPATVVVVAPLAVAAERAAKYAAEQCTPKEAAADSGRTSTAPEAPSRPEGVDVLLGELVGVIGEVLRSVCRGEGSRRVVALDSRGEAQFALRFADPGRASTPTPPRRVSM